MVCDGLDTARPSSTYWGTKSTLALCEAECIAHSTCKYFIYGRLSPSNYARRCYGYPSF